MTHILTGSKRAPQELSRTMDINELFKRIAVLGPSNERHNLIIKLIDDYTSKEIIPFLFDLIKNEKIKDLDATLVFACGEYSIEECVPHFEQFVEIVIHSHYEAAMTASGVLNEMRDYYDKLGYSKIMEIRNKLIGALNSTNENYELLQDVLFYCEDYLGLIPDNA